MAKPWFVRLAIVLIFTLLAAGFAVEAVAARATNPTHFGYGYCKDCNCPGYGGLGNRCSVRTCGHYFTRHY